MGTQGRRQILAALIVGAAAIASDPSAAQDCRAIKDAAARLACFDKAPAKPRAPAKAAVVDAYAPAKQAMLKKLTDPASATWGEFWEVQSAEYGPMVCGAVNAKNRMGGYDGMTGFIYVPARAESILLFSGNTDPNAGIATVQYRKYWGLIYLTPSLFRASFGTEIEG